MIAAVSRKVDGRWYVPGLNKSFGLSCSIHPTAKADGSNMKHAASVLLMLVLVGCAQNTLVYGPGDIIVPREVVLAPTGTSPGVTLGARRVVIPGTRFEYELLVRNVGDSWLAAAQRLSVQTDDGILVLNDPSSSAKQKKLYGGRRCEERAFPVSADQLRLIAASSTLSIVGHGFVEIGDLQLFRNFVRDHVR
jgi:hypothetical protein